MKFHPFRANEKNSQRVSRSTEADSTRPAKATSRYLRHGVAGKRGISAINLAREHFNCTMLILHRGFARPYFSVDFHACISSYEGAFVFRPSMLYHSANYRVTLSLPTFHSIPFLRAQHITRWHVSTAIDVPWIVRVLLSIASIVSSRPIAPRSRIFERRSADRKNG